MRCREPALAVHRQAGSRRLADRLRTGSRVARVHPARVASFEEIEKNESYVLSLGTLKKADEIEKLVKRIRARLRHY